MAPTNPNAAAFDPGINFGQPRRERQRPSAPGVVADPKTLAKARVAARAARIRMIRRRVVAGALALFVAAWVFITLQLVSGNDPALSKSAQTSSAVTSSSSPSVSSSQTGLSTAASGGSTSGSGSTSQNSSSGGTSVTTQQS
jgi:hypothetical protein